MEGMKVESRLPQLLYGGGGMQGVQSDEDAPLQCRSDPGRSTGLEQFLKPSVAKAADHTQGL